MLPVVLPAKNSEIPENGVAGTFRLDAIQLDVLACDNENGSNVNKKKKKKKKLGVVQESALGTEENGGRLLEATKASRKKPIIEKTEIIVSEETASRRASDTSGVVVKQGKKSRGTAGTQRSEDVEEYKGGGGWSLEQLVEFIDNGRKPRLCFWREEDGAAAGSTELGVAEDKEKTKQELFVQR